MIASTRRWFRRNRTNLLIGAGVIGAGYVAGQYVWSRIQEARQRATDERVAKENLRRRFEQNQEDCTYTVLALLPTIREEIISALPVEQITDQLQQERQERLRRLGQSEAASSEYPSVPPSVVDDDGKSLSSSSFIHASQLASSSIEGGSTALRPKRSKAQLWQEMKINSITRALTLIYTLSLLTILTRIQLNLLGRRTYLSSVVALASPPTAQQSSTISLENKDDDGYENVYGNDFDTNRKYLTFSWWLLHRGSKQIMDRVSAAVKEVFGAVNIREDMTLKRLASLVMEVRRKVEGATTEERMEMRWLPFLLPPKADEASVMRQASASDGEESPSLHAQTDPLETTTDAQDDQDSIHSSLRRLLDETSDLIDSPTFSQVLTRLLDAAYSQLVDYHIATEAFKDPGPTAPGTVVDEPRVSEVSEPKIKLAHILPVFCRQAHVIAAGSGEVDTIGSIAGQDGFGNEYLATIDRVHDLEAFAAVIYSSNFEQELADQRADFRRSQEDEASAQSATRSVGRDPTVRPQEGQESSIPVPTAGVAASSLNDGPPVLDLPGPAPSDAAVYADLESAWRNALAREDGRPSADAPIPVEDG